MPILRSIQNQAKRLRLKVCQFKCKLLKKLNPSLCFPSNTVNVAYEKKSLGYME